MMFAPSVQQSSPAESAQSATAETPAKRQCLMTDLDKLIAATPSCEISPLCFFVSWQGVLTLAYRGFCPALCTLKAQVEGLGLGLPKENPGSKWPKTSLGCLKDDKRLTPDDLQKLNDICKSCSKNLDGRPDLTMTVQAAAVAVYGCRSLEKVITWHEVEFLARKCCKLPSDEEQSRVAAVVAEADAPDYWIRASKDGNREQHYRGNCIGATLVCKPRFTPLAWPEARPFANKDGLLDLPISSLTVIRQFREQVEAGLPGMYAWFSDQSLHMTLRALT